MLQNISETRNFTSEVSFTDLHQNTENSVYNLKFKKKLFADGQELAIEEEILVQLRKDEVLVQQGKPRTPGQRPTQEQPTPPAKHEETGAYASFDRSDAAIEAILNTYVLPLYE